MDFLAFSHLRWNFVFQRPQHLLSRFAQHHRVFFWEEPVFDHATPYLEMTQTAQGVCVLVPHLPASIAPSGVASAPAGLAEDERNRLQQMLLSDLVAKKRINDCVLWYYNPMAVHFSRLLRAQVVVYDCMDELSGFRGAPMGLRAAEAALFARADLVFTGGQSLHKAKKRQHSNVYCLPSSIDRDFFHSARRYCAEPNCQPSDQFAIPRPRLGYSGVIDERMDVDLLRDAAALRPDWQFVMVGPVVKISEEELPKAPNIHWLGGKPYNELPLYMAGWDVGLLPFARNESTRFISPTKTPEYLAAGLPVVSTSIADVVRPYGVEKLVHIADDPSEFVQSAEQAMLSRNSRQRLASVDKFLAQMSWDVTWSRMAELVERVARDAQPIAARRLPAALSSPPPSFAVGD
jgi:glycosyltransferase involved in cell wall biosynthesis